jgi:DNA-binding response OmpR family regulator
MDSERPPHILVVDDDEMVLQVLKRTLSRSGFMVSTAQEPLPILEVAKGGEIDCLLLDLVLPAKEAARLIEELHEVRPGVPVIVCSGHSRESLEAGLRQKIAGYLQKPFASSELLAMVRSTLKG